MYIVVNSNNKIIASANYEINEEDCASRGESIHYIDNLMYTSEMVNSLYTENEPYYIKAPTIFHEIVDNAWEFTESSNTKCLAAVTGIRNKLLAATDWTLLPDSPLSDADKQEWIRVRDELRNIKITHTDPLVALQSLDSFALLILK